MLPAAVQLWPERKELLVVGTLLKGPVCCWFSYPEDPAMLRAEHIMVRDDSG